jgi:hypothetical protein
MPSGRTARRSCVGRSLVGHGLTHLYGAPSDNSAVAGYAGPVGSLASALARGSATRFALADLAGPFRRQGALA